MAEWKLAGHESCRWYLHITAALITPKIYIHIIMSRWWRSCVFVSRKYLIASPPKVMMMTTATGMQTEGGMVGVFCPLNKTEKQAWTEVREYLHASSSSSSYPPAGDAFRWM